MTHDKALAIAKEISATKRQLDAHYRQFFDDITRGATEQQRYAILQLSIMLGESESIFQTEEKDGVNFTKGFTNGARTGGEGA